MLLYFTFKSKYSTQKYSALVVGYCYSLVRHSQAVWPHQHFLALLHLVYHCNAHLETSWVLVSTKQIATPRTTSPLNYVKAGVLK